VLSPRTASPLLQQLETISSPVPDLASTLTTQADHLPNNDTISFLRTRLEDASGRPVREELTAAEIERLRQYRANDRRYAESLRLHPTMSRRTPLGQDAGESSSYANRVPQRQSLYDWAPGSEDEDLELYHELLSRANIPTFAQSARRQSRYLNIDSHRRSHSRSGNRLRHDDATRSPTWAEAARRETSPSRTESSFATAALLQSVEQHRRFNARARSTLQSYILERDRRNQEPTPSSSTWARLHRTEHQPPGSPYPTIRNLSSQNDLRHAYRQLFLDNPSLSRLKDTIRYLSKLRHCESLEEGLALVTELTMDDTCAAGHKRPIHRFFKLSDLIVETSTLPPVSECSWLTPGSVFVGSQHTPREPLQLTYSRDRDRRYEEQSQNPSHSLQQRARRRATSHAAIRSSYRDRLPLPPLPDITLQHSSEEAHPPNSTTPMFNSQGVPSDHWPVTITLHDIDFSTMTLSGTMSATHIPDKSIPDYNNPTPTDETAGGGSSMQSFFVGEILDLRIHSLETENFPSEGVSTDARYWRGVGPFRELLQQHYQKNHPSKDLDERKNGSGRRRSGFAPLDGRPGMDVDNEAGDDDVVEDAQGGEDVIASALRSRSWIEEKLLKEWILMRWKEKCFIPRSSPADANLSIPSAGRRGSPDPASYGLTISGYYYVALRRQTGEIEGLYYDPGSLPFQVLSLRPQRGGVKTAWPAQAFR
jgi:Vacuolar import and degradation protein